MKSNAGNKNKSSSGSISPHAHFKNVADKAVALKIFDIIEQNPQTSQRKITLQTGLAAGLVHSFMQRVVSKGWIRAKQVNAKRWLYFLTPEGFRQKSRLTMNYLSRTLDTYRDAQNLVQKQLGICSENNWRRLVVAGENELAEITVLNIRAFSSVFTVEGIISQKQASEKIVGLDVLRFPAVKKMEYSKIIVCDINFQLWNQKQKNPIMESKLINLLDLVELLGDEGWL